MNNRVQTLTMKRIVKESGKCELCGSKRCLEAHHIIPVVCGGDDSEDNLICVCGVCHARLTPKSILTKIGIEAARGTPKDRFKQKLYEKIDQYIEERGYADSSLIMDAIEDL